MGTGKEIDLYIIPHTNGRWKAVEEYVGGDGKRHSVSTIIPDRKQKTLKETKEKLLNKIRKKEKKEKEEKEKILTLGELVDLYLKYHESVSKPQTVAGLQGKLRGISAALGEDTSVDRLTAPYCNGRITPPGARASLRNERITRLKALVRWGARQGYIKEISWIMGLDRYPDKEAAERRQVKFLEKEEISCVLDEMGEKHWRLLTQFLLLTGLRAGEALALERGDVNLETKEIRITKTWASTIGELSPTPKTEAGNRIISVQEELIVIIKNIQAYFSAVRTSYKVRSKLLFHNERGEYMSLRAYEKYFRSVCQRTIGRPLTPHSLRHTHTAQLAAAGVPLETIARRLGHRDSGVTRRIYMHVTQDLQKQDADRLNGVSIL